MAVHKDIRHVLLDMLEDGRAHSDIGDKVAVHDICKVSMQNQKLTQSYQRAMATTTND